MQKRLFVWLLITVGFVQAHAQSTDKTPPYLKDSTIIDFTITLTDSTDFTKSMIPAGRPVVIVYFSPDCSHCQLTAHEFEEKKTAFSNVFFIWVSYLAMDKIKTFADEYHMTGKENIRIGRDANYTIPGYYKVKYTPFIAVYNTAGILLQTYDGGTEPETILNLLHTTP
jgi:thioredoxin-related protein